MFGQIPDFSNGFEFLRHLWGASSAMPNGLMPGLQAMTPPMDLDEVDKRIHDLKAVESWLQLNANLLRTTIQGLEVQRATLVALQTFGQALSPDAMQSAMENVARAANAPSAAPHHHAFTTPAQQADAEDAADAYDPDTDPANFVADEPDAGDEGDRADEGDDGENTEALPDDAPADAAAADSQGAALPPNASLWWNLLQQQFNQIASGAAAASMAPFGGVGGMSPGMPGAGAPQAAPARAPEQSAAPKAPKAAPKKAVAKKVAAKKVVAKKVVAKKVVAKKVVVKNAAAKKAATKATAKKTTRKAAEKAASKAPAKPTTAPRSDGGSDHSA